MNEQKQKGTLHKISKGLTFLFMALTIIYAAVSLTFYGNDEGIQWFMLRDQPLLAAILLVCASISGLLWFISSRVSRKLGEK